MLMFNIKSLLIFYTLMEDLNILTVFEFIDQISVESCMAAYP